MGPKETKFDGNLDPAYTLWSQRAWGSGDRGSISPGEGDGAGSNSLPRTIRIAVWEIFSVSSRSRKFFQGASRYRKIILDQKTLIVRARAPPHRQYATSPKFFSSTILFWREFFSKYSRAPAQKRKKCEKIHSHSHNKIIVPLIVWVIVWGLTHCKSTS